MSAATRILASLAAVAVMGGCRAGERPEPQTRTIVVRDAAPREGESALDVGEGFTGRIEVVVDAEPHVEAAGPSPLSALLGRRVRVQFRRDALGVAAPAPIPPMGQGPGGRAVDLSGTVRSATGSWLVLERDGTTCWLPQAAILLIEVPDQPTTTPAGE